MDRHDLWMGKPGGDADLALEAARLHATGLGAGEHLDRDRPVEPEVAGEVHGGHAALPELALDLIATGERLVELDDERRGCHGLENTCRGRNVVIPSPRTPPRSC